MPEVSIIIPTYNRAKIIKKTIRSILDQTFIDYEMIIISNGSTDNTQEIVKSFNDPRIIFVLQNGSGSPASPRNHGIKISKGKYVAFCDDDDIWLPKKLEQQMALLNSDSKVGICYTRMRRFNDEKKWINTDEELDDVADVPHLLYKNVIPLSSVVLRKDILVDMELFDEDKKIAGAEDYELMLRISKKTPMACIQEYFIEYYSGDNRFSSVKESFSLITNIKYIIRLYYVYFKVVKKGAFKWHEVVLPFLKNAVAISKIIAYNLYKRPHSSLKCNK